VRTTGRRPVRRAATCLSLLGVLAAVGCGGSSGDDDDQSTASEGSATVSTSKVSGYGTVLATKGRSLYVLTSDPAGGSTCTAACAIKWHPLTAAGQATAAAGVDPSKLGSFKRDDGTEQILYNNRALYTYTGTGLASGVGVKSEGGTWYLVSPAGKPITTTASGGY
jgi:predicted lipoprotein with Yx(FWY)xxD motif